MTEFGFPMGPLAAGDLAGLDISWRMRKAQGLRAGSPTRYVSSAATARRPERDSIATTRARAHRSPIPRSRRLIQGRSARLGVDAARDRRQGDRRALLFPMINEGARILDEGIGGAPSDIDVIWVFGYGFPSWRGGPMHYADVLGLGYVRRPADGIRARTGDERHKPAPLLAKLAAEGKGFADGG